MELAIISFARKDSTRLPGKNYKKLRGVPMLWYTLRSMNYIYMKLYNHNIFCERYLLTDWKECEKLAVEMSIPVIWRDHPKEWDDNRLNKWAHEKIKAKKYLLLQPTSPLRDNEKILEWTTKCLEADIKSAFAVKYLGDLIFKRVGSFFFYDEALLNEDKLNDDNSVIFQDNEDIDVDTIENFREVERRIDENAINLRGRVQPSGKH
jgi:CMP-N-acetylneuraminic acid synthetase